jgi:hypothetical protein
MKLTKSQLKQIIKEELLKEELNPIEGMQSLYNSWQPETDEGMEYKADLGKVIERLGGGGQTQSSWGGGPGDYPDV